MKKIVLLSMGGLAVVSLIFWWMNSNSPKSSLYELEDAFNDHDYITFEKYVDVESMVSDFMDVFIKKDGGVEKNGALLELLKGKIVEMATVQVKKMIEDPNFDNKELKKNQFLHLLSEKKIVEGIGDVRKDGKIAYVDVMLHFKDTILPITLKMRDRGENWQLFGFEDLEGFFEKMEELKDKE